MYKWLAFLLALFAPASDAQWNTWSQQDQLLFVASQVAITADWSTTHYFSKNINTLGKNSFERNFVLGKYPSTEQVDIYFSTMLITNYFITDALPKNLRGIYLGARIVSHGSAAYHNVQLGWRMQF